MTRADEALKGLKNILNLRLKNRPLKIILDPGHGGTDPGAVGNGTTEAAQVWEFAGTLLYYLKTVPGVEVRLSRTRDIKPSWFDRTFGLGRADIAIALHMDTAQGGRSMAYYPMGMDYRTGPSVAASCALAHCFQDATPDPEFVCLPDTDSRFKRLYIRGFNARAVCLWELDPVHPLTRAERIERAAQCFDALALALQRVGVIIA